MSEPVAGFHSIITSLNITAAQASLPGFPPVALANPLTYDRFRSVSTVSTTLVVDAGVAVPVDYFGIATHNLGTLQATVAVWGNTTPDLTGTPVVVGSITPPAGNTGNRPAVALASATVTTRYFIIRFTTSYPDADVPFDVGAFYLGERMTFERCIMRSHAPAPLNRKTDFYDNDSEDGQFLGRSIIRRGFVTDVSFDKMTAPWVRGEFQEFVLSAQLAPYFFVWNPSLYPDEVIFGRTSEDIGAQYTGIKNLMSAAWKIKGVGHSE